MAFRREKGVARGGPAGGSGGRGGSVYLVAEHSSNTLSKFRAGAAFRARDGRNGTGKARTGECAADVRVPVPVGTIIRTENGKLLADLSRTGVEFCAAKGGRGGRGNLAFKTDKNRAPRMCETGEKGVERWLRLELKLVADVALVGMPNAGKSTFLRCVSNAKPKVADYPFTTVIPNLGVVDGEDGNGLVFADVPGLVEGAHRGVGMGAAFLRHIERCKVVLHLLDGTADDPISRYNAIRGEMELYSDTLGRKKEVVLVNKVDLPGVRERWENGLLDELVQTITSHKRIALVSAMDATGVRDVLRRLRLLVDSVPDENDVVILGDEDQPQGPGVVVQKLSTGLFEIAGWKVEKVYQMTNWDYVEGVDRFQRILEAIGVNAQLKASGATNGDTVLCQGREFEYTESENVYSSAAMMDGYAD